MDDLVTIKDALLFPRAWALVSGLQVSWKLAQPLRLSTKAQVDGNLPS